MILLLAVGGASKVLDCSSSSDLTTASLILIAGPLSYRLDCPVCMNLPSSVFPVLALWVELALKSRIPSDPSMGEFNLRLGNNGGSSLAK